MLNLLDIVAFFRTLQVSSSHSGSLPRDAPWFMMHPNNRFLWCWDWLLRLLACYFCFEVPWNIAFRATSRFGLEYEIMNTFLESLLLLDMVINLCRAFYNANGVLVYKSRAARQAYVARTFFFDLVAAMPFDWLVVANGNVSDKYVRKSIKLVCLLHDNDVAHDLNLSHPGFLAMCSKSTAAHSCSAGQNSPLYAGGMVEVAQDDSHVPHTAFLSAIAAEHSPP
jgi:hypothetical protein